MIRICSSVYFWAILHLKSMNVSGSYLDYTSNYGMKMARCDRRLPVDAADIEDCRIKHNTMYVPLHHLGRHSPCGSRHHKLSGRSDRLSGLVDTDHGIVRQREQQCELVDDRHVGRTRYQLDADPQILRLLLA